MPQPAKLEWRNGKYGGAYLDLGDGLVNISVHYAVVARGEESHYSASINHLKLNKHFKDMDEAKEAVLRVATRLTTLAAEQLKNFNVG